MSLSKNTFDYIFHHVVLPPKLPQEDDLDEEESEWNLDRKLHVFVQEQWQSFVESGPPGLKARLDVVGRMLESWLEVDKQGSICKDTLTKIISDVKTHGAAALYIRAQNCGWIAYYDHGRCKLIVDAFEASPRAADVLAAPGSIQRCFPGSSVAIPGENVDRAFCSWLSCELARLYDEDVSDMMAKSRKAKVTVIEERDTTHPGLVTECLMAQLLAYGEHEQWPVFQKHMRDEVNWRSSKLPWRRSPRWFVMRVAMQTLGRMTVHVRPEISPDPLHIIQAKIGRRVCKLKEGLYDHVAEQIRETVAILEARLQKIQQAIIESNAITVPDSFTLTRDDQRMSLKNCGRYLRSPRFDRNYEQRAPQNRHGLPILSNAETISLADVEHWVETMLGNWLRDRQPSEHSCSLLACLFQTYSEYALQTYAGCPDLMSEMLLTLLELWVAIDKICIDVDYRLQEYSPEIPPDFLEPLLLPEVRQMQRAKDVETYICARHRNKASGLPQIFGDPAQESFVTRYFDTCTGLQQRRASIEAHARHQLEEKQRELNTKSSQYCSLLSKAKGMKHHWVPDRRGKSSHDPACQACGLEKQAASMRIEVYEWPLPTADHLIKTVVFELACPEWFKAWRDVTWRLVHDFGRTRTKQARNVELNLMNYKETRQFAVNWGQRLTLGSKTKSWKRAHYSTCKFPVSFKDLSRPSGLQFRLLDSKTNSWVEDQDGHPNVKSQCTFVISKGPYRHLQYAVDTFRHTENEVIADQKNCHPKLSLHEFVAFGCLRAGERVQWHNMIRELASAALSFNAESVSILFRQAAWEMGTANPGTCLREAHGSLQEKPFVDRLLETLELRLNSIETNWNQYHALHLLVILGLRALSTCNDRAVRDRTLQFLRRSRKIAVQWCEELALTLDDQSGEQGAMQQAMIVRIGAICQLTYWVEPKHVSAVLQSRDDLYYLARSSIMVFENSPRNWEGASAGAKSILVRATKVLHSLEQHTRGLITGDASGLVDAIRKSAPNLETSAAWEFCPGTAARWAINQSATARGRRQTVHYDLLSGELLIDCAPPGRLPKEYTENPLFKRIFGPRTLTVVPSNLPGSAFMSSRLFGNYQIHFSMHDNDLIIKAQHDFGVLRLVPHDKLQGDFPDDFISNRVHWMDEDHILEFRTIQQIWNPCPRNWRLTFCPSTEQGVMMQGGKTLVDIHGQLFQQLAAVLGRLDEPRYMNVVADQGTVEIELVRLRLRFVVNTDGTLEACELNATVDKDQDIGCFYGLKSKLVLQCLNKRLSRSVLVPYGNAELATRPEHPVVSIRQPTLDPYLGMLRAPDDMLSTLYQAYLHALTGFAVRILRQEWLRRSFPLDAGCIDLLRRIASLTPQRRYYPGHLKSMQTIFWNSELGQMAQADDFRFLVQEIVGHANRFSPLYGIRDNEREAAEKCYRDRGDQYLLDRARSRNALFRRSETDAMEASPTPDTSPYESRDRGLQSERSRRVYSIAALIRSWPSSPPPGQNLLEAIGRWQHVCTPGRLINDYTCTELLHVSLEDAWGPLYERCRSSDRLQGSYSLMSLFGMIAFGGRIQLSQVKPLLAVAFTGAFKDLPIPGSCQGRVLELQRGADFVHSEIERAIEACYPAFRSPAVMLGLKQTAEMTLDGELEYTRQKEKDIRECVGAITAQWPCQRLGIPRMPKIEMIQALADCERLCTTWYQNREFLNFVQQVQDRLDTRTNEGLVDHHFRDPPPHGTIPTTVPSRPPDIFELLRQSKPPTAPRKPPPIRFRRAQAPQRYDINTELESLIRELYDSSDPDCRELGENLLESFDALTETELPCSSPAPGVRPLLVQYQKLLQGQRDSLWASIYAALATEGPGQSTAAQVVWPRINRYSALSLLAVDRWERVPAAWRAPLLALAEIISSLRRSERLLACYDQKDSNGFFKEAENAPCDGWNGESSPEWLLFEIENDLTIRQAQAVVAAEETNPSSGGNAVYQMNMGEGKTTVITPLVVMNLVRIGELPQVVVLKPLLRQSVHLLSRLGGMLNRRIYHLPFSRDTPVDKSLVEELEEVYRECHARRGILIALPEHILSFRLLGQDLASRGSNVADRVIRLAAWLQDTCRNVIDESDEVLDPKFQLVYTVGHQRTMDGHSDRWEIAQALFTILESEAIELQREDPTCLGIEQRDARYPMFHFLKDGTLDRLIQRVLVVIDKGGLPSVPFTQWTRQVRRSALHFIQFTGTMIRDEKVVREALDGTIVLQRLLILRGLLAHGIFRFAVGGKRWLVDYGLHPSRCLMAVPFRAKGVPSDNAEFGHPDVAIVLTCLSYYYHGLSQEQTRHCFDLVAKETDPAAEYQRWILRGSSSLPTGLRSITGVNLDNGQVFQEVLYPHLQFQKHLIDFYLSRVVFPKEAKEFRQKLSTSAWDLPSRPLQPLTTGFSGTNDNQSLLPRSTPQRDLPHLLHTNATVLNNLLRPENRRCILAQDDQGLPLRTHQLVDLVNDQEPSVRVIIDVGAQILESSNRSVAQYWLSRTQSAHGALFYDDHDEPTVVDRDGHTESLLASPFRYRMETCLVFLDQQHARGVDLKLPPSYRAAVTLGPRLTKDKLVQACNRMRGLGSGQSVMFLCPPEVSHEMEVEADRMTSADVIRWALRQTCESLKALKPLWASQGLSYYKRIRLWDDLVGNIDPQETVARIQEPEARTVSELYAPWDAIHQSTPQYNQNDPIVQELIRAGNGAGRYPSLHEEQERQISHEVQREQQVFRPPKVSPRPHRLHEYVRSFVRQGEWPADGTSDAIRPAFEALCLQLGEFDAPSTIGTHLYVSGDFIRTVEGKQACDFLKPAHWVVSNVCNSKLLLISQYEANELLPEIRASPRTTLHVFAPRTSKWMRSFQDLRFLCTGSPMEHERSIHDNHELELFSGSLYFTSFKVYERFRHFLGLVTESTSPLLGKRLLTQGFVNEQTRREIGWPLRSPFQSNPMPFLNALFNARSKGHGYLQTHIGMILGGRELTVDHF
ncbi:hypothetical protein BJX61DRAFT_549716 [Aspergillus egyptiacus]|nr:hypothetical protein BJX61DRAFT_549716 [Aspergillus egyptiacus]